MDELWDAPAKLNLTLRVGASLRSGLHPIESLAQTIDWADTLRFTFADEDHLVVEGADIPDDGDNLVWRAVRRLLPDRRQQLEVVLTKRIPAAAGLGGGSSDAACVIAALGDWFGVEGPERLGAAADVGADVTFFLTGGTALMTGVGEKIERLDPLDGFVVVVAVPEFETSTPAVYRRWDEMNRPTGSVVPARRLPPGLRDVEVVNDLTPAAIDLAPGLGDVLVELGQIWERPVMMSGSGSAVFACFADLDEARDAEAGLGAGFRASAAVGLRRHGVSRLDR